MADAAAAALWAFGPVRGTTPASSASQGTRRWFDGCEERTETVSGTVRHTEVEVDNERAMAPTRNPKP